MPDTHPTSQRVAPAPEWAIEVDADAALVDVRQLDAAMADLLLDLDDQSDSASVEKEARW